MIGNKPFSRPTPNELKDTLLDDYNGVRAAPVDTALNGFHIEKTINKNIGFAVVNQDNVGNAAQANLTVKGAGPLYTNNTGISHYNNGYNIQWVKNSGLFYSDKILNIATWNDNPIVFRTGSTFAGVTPKLTINSNGQIKIGVQPKLNNTVTKLLGIDPDGNIVTLDK